MNSLARKARLYLRAAFCLRRLNLLGLPIVPKFLYPYAPHNRGAFNEFILWIRQQLQIVRASVIFDVGANHGDFSLAASCCFRDSDIWLFEPIPNLQPELQTRASHQKNHWHLQSIALGSRCEVLPLQIDSGNDAIGSLVGFGESYLQINPEARANTKIDVQVETLDGFCEEHSIRKIDLLKIDVEGFEFDVLDGAMQMLERTQAIIIEVSLVRKAQGEPGPLLEMIRRLTAAGFHIVGLIPMRLDRGEESWLPVEYNVLARKRGGAQA
jgi:FkbM family methyltransferase